MTFSERAKPLKDKGNLTLKQIAELCNISESMASRYINGSNVPPEDIARKMLDVLSASAENAETKPTHATSISAEMINFYVNTIESQRQTFEAALSDAKTDRRRWFIVSLVLIVFVMFIASWDITHPDMGYIRY